MHLVFEHAAGVLGPAETAARILYAFGSAWLVFAIASNVGSEWTGWAALLLHPLLTVPFFALAWISQRWPRVGGALLLVASVFFVRFFNLFQKEHVGLITEAITFILFIGPLLASGVALLFTGTRLMAPTSRIQPPRAVEVCHRDALFPGVRGLRFAPPHTHQVKKNPDGIDRGGHGEPQRRMQFCRLCSSALSAVTR